MESLINDCEAIKSQQKDVIRTIRRELSLESVNLNKMEEMRKAVRDIASEKAKLSKFPQKTVDS